MARLRLLPSLFLLRGAIRELRGIREQLARQTAAIERLAQHYAPADPDTDPAIVAADTGASFVDTVDSALILAYVERTKHDTGRMPTDDEILIYLADEKTRDLHERLTARDEALARLAADRGAR